MAQVRSGARVQVQQRPASYYVGSRPEVAALVPARCVRVLEVGCGTGQLGRLLTERGHRVTGLELVPEVAEQARPWLDRVVTGDVEADGFPFPPASFDAVLFADVLEHLVDPWRVLREAVQRLTDDGRVIASIPNVQHKSVLGGLVRGRWSYRDHGITDVGHLRFFTLQTIRGLFQQAGLRIEHVGYLYRRTWWRAVVCFLTAGRARGFYTSQYLVVGRKR
jgi:SAM-dependent methyltransferase